MVYYTSKLSGRKKNKIFFGSSFISFYFIQFLGFMVSDCFELKMRTISFELWLFVCIASGVTLRLTST